MVLPLAAVLLVTISPGSSPARQQTNPPTEADSAPGLEEIVREMDLPRDVRIRTSSGDTLRGRLLSVAGRRLELESVPGDGRVPEATTRFVSFSDVTALEDRTSSLASSVAVGGTVLGVVGAVVGLAARSSRCGNAGGRGSLADGAGVRSGAVAAALDRSARLDFAEEKPRRFGPGPAGECAGLLEAAALGFGAGAVVGAGGGLLVGTLEGGGWTVRYPLP